MSTLLNIVEILRDCPTHQPSVTPELVNTVWHELTRTELTGKPAVPVLMALILHDHRFARLFTEAENQQLAALAQLARDRYVQQTQPSNKFGQLLAGIIPKNEI